ncbi:hypothetical protein Hanom_Chr09g00839131 [Helianthus anomalus]
MFTSNCRRCPLAQKLTGFVLNVSKSYTLCPLGQTQLDFLVKSGDMEGVHSYVEGICERNGLVGVVEDDMEGVHSSQFLGKNGEEWANGGSFLFL